MIGNDKKEGRCRKEKEVEWVPDGGREKELVNLYPSVAIIAITAYVRLEDKTGGDPDEAGFDRHGCDIGLTEMAASTKQEGWKPSGIGVKNK